MVKMFFDDGSEAKKIVDHAREVISFNVPIPDFYCYDIRCFSDEKEITMSFCFGKRFFQINYNRQESSFNIKTDITCFPFVKSGSPRSYEVDLVEFNDFLNSIHGNTYKIVVDNKDILFKILTDTYKFFELI